MIDRCTFWLPYSLVKHGMQSRHKVFIIAPKSKHRLDDFQYCFDHNLENTQRRIKTHQNTPIKKRLCYH